MIGKSGQSALAAVDQSVLGQAPSRRIKRSSTVTDEDKVDKPEPSRKRGSLGIWIARAGLLGILLIAATGAFLGMGLFMWNMGNDINKFTRPESIMNPFR
jgi:hypothetical protein